MENLFEIQRVLIEQYDGEYFYPRACFNQFTYDNRLTGLIGPRGIGKTTFLLHEVIRHGVRDKKALYISADSYYLINLPLIELVDQLYKETDIRFLCIDEIQKYSNWNQELKNIADTYRDFRVLFTGSSMIDLVKSKFDLSRRATLHHLHGFSFREYLEFTEQRTLPILTVEDILTRHEKIVSDLNIPHVLKRFHDYLESGHYPFFSEFSLDREKFQAIEFAVSKTIYEDIGTSYSLKTPTLLILEKSYRYIVGSLPGEISAYKLSSVLSKDYESIREYLRILEQAGLIRFLHSEKSGKSLLKQPAKMYPDNSNLVYSAPILKIPEVTSGKVRETFVMNQLCNSGHSVYFPEKGDFKIQNWVFEVGGKNKTVEQLKGIPSSYLFCDGIIVGSRNKVPLYLLGFLY